MQKGFTLLEIMLYIGISSLIISSLVALFFEITDEDRQIQSKLMLISEGDFLIHKIEWILATVAVPVSPSLNGEGNSFIGLDSTGQEVSLFEDENNLDFLKEGSTTILNSSAYSISQLNFKLNSISSSSSIIFATFKIGDLSFEALKVFP